MKPVLAALFLLLQLQPMLGVAACLGLVRQPAQQECKMPEHGTAPTQQLSQPVPLSGQSCALASVCAPAAPAVPSFVGQLESSVPLHAVAAIAGDMAPPEVATAPPFHPPRV